MEWSSSFPVWRMAPVCVVWVLVGCSKGPAPSEPIRAVKVFQVAESGLVATREFSGEVRARAESRLGFRVGGKVTRRAVDVGQRVVAGQLLATLDAQDLLLGANAARSGVQSAQVQADLAGAEFKRFKDLRDQNFISGAELERREAVHKAALAALEQAKSVSALQGNQSGYAQLVAPAAGVVVAADLEVGMVVAPGAPVLRLALDSGRDAVFAVPEDVLPTIKLGQSVALRLPNALPLQGVVREIAAAADPATRTFGVKVGIASPQLALGSTVYATPQAGAQPGAMALKLPTAALRQEAGQSSVWVLDRQALTVKARTVQVLGADGNEVVIAPGALQGGEWVVATGVHVLSAGQRVTVWEGVTAGKQNLANKSAIASDFKGFDATKNIANNQAHTAHAAAQTASK